MKTVTELTIFDVEGQPVKIKVQRPRLLSMAAQGKIPNALLGIATKVVNGKGIEQGNIKELAQMIELYCRVCMVEPAYDEIKLDDDQMFEIFTWATTGVRQLENFRNQQENGTNNRDVKSVPKKAE